MAAPSVAMMMGAETSAAHVAVEGKAADTGKSFAESLDEHIAADADVGVQAAAEMNAQQNQQVTQTWANGVEQKSGRESVASANAAQASDDGTHAVSMPVIKGPIVFQAPTGQTVTAVTGSKVTVYDVKAPGANVATTSMMQEAGAEAATAGQGSDVAAQEPSDGDVRPLDEAATVTPETACVSGGRAQSEQVQSVKTQISGRVLQIARASAASSVTGTEADIQAAHPAHESVPASSEKNVSTGSGESVAPSKETEKKHGAAKVEGLLKAADAGAGAGMVTGATAAAAPTAVVSQSVAQRGATDSVSQTSVGAASKQGSAAAAVVGAKAAALPAGSLQGNSQHSTPAKTAGDSAGASSQMEPGSHIAQKNEQAPAKPVDSPGAAALPQAITQTVKSSAKLQNADAVALGSHTAGAAGTAANASGVNAVLQVPIAATQKITPGGIPAAFPAPHAGSGDLSGAVGSQATTLNDPHKTLVATPTVLEVGIPNGTQGWLKVRAELTGGGVNASLSAASPAGQEMLHRELPALTTYLQQEKVAVNSLVVQAPVTGGFRGLSGGSGGYSGGQPQQQGQGSSGRDNVLPGSGTAHSDMNRKVADDLPVTMQYPSGGGWLSVRA